MKTTIAASLALGLALLVAACGSDSEGSSDGPRVTATTGIVADIAERVAGDHAEVEQLIPDGSSPHDFQLSAKDRAGIEDSVLVVSNGAGLESGVQVEDFDVDGFALTDHVGTLLPAGEAGAHEEDEDPEGEEEHADEAGDPHVWMDPTRTARALPALAEALAAADAEHANGYRNRAEEYAAELTALDRELERGLAEVPPADRELVTSHDALAYFADRYGFEVIATPFPSSGAEAEASAAHLRDVERAIARSEVPAVFAEAEDDPEVLELIAGDTGVEVIDDLLVESPADTGSYVEMLRHDAELIAMALGSG